LTAEKVKSYGIVVVANGTVNLEVIVLQFEVQTVHPFGRAVLR
jgi:hypothetical protein